MTKPRASLRSDNCPVSIGNGVRFESEQVSDFVGIRTGRLFLVSALPRCESWGLSVIPASAFRSTHLKTSYERATSRYPDL
jgi:hypothetical protein